MLVVFVPANGKPEKRHINADDTLHEFQRLVGGYIEIVRPYMLPNDWVMVIDEEGKLKGKPVNRVCTALYASSWDNIVGDAFLLREDMVETEDGMEPDLVGLSEAEADDCISRFIPKVLRYDGM